MSSAAPRCLVLVHVYYPDLWEEIARGLCNLDGAEFDLYVNVVEGRTDADWERALRQQFANARVFYSCNRGADIGGTLNLLGHVQLTDYDLVCKLHTKKSEISLMDGAQWRRELLRACLEGPQEVIDIFANQPRVSMLGCRRWVVHHHGGLNYDACLRLCDRLGLDRSLAAGTFVAGTMFWCRPFVMQRLKDSGLRQEEFEEGHARDGTLAHAVERIFGAIARSQGEVYGR